MELYSAVENEAVKIPVEWVDLGIVISGVTQPRKMEGTLFSFICRAHLERFWGIFFEAGFPCVALAVLELTL